MDLAGFAKQILKDRLREVGLIALPVVHGELSFVVQILLRSASMQLRAQVYGLLHVLGGAREVPCAFEGVRKGQQDLQSK